MGTKKNHMPALGKRCKGTTNYSVSQEQSFSIPDYYPLAETEAGACNG